MRWTAGLQAFRSNGERRRAHVISRKKASRFERRDPHRRCAGKRIDDQFPQRTALLHERLTKRNGFFRGITFVRVRRVE